MTPVPDPILFNAGDLFHDMVAAYITAVVGVEGIVDPSNPMKYYQGQPGVGLEGKVHTKFVVDTFVLWRRYQLGEVKPPIMVASLCQMLANTAYESVAHRNDRSPEFEFFRHVRNASSHGGRFNFRNQEPTRPAAWRGVAIDHLAKASVNPLCGKYCFFDLLGPADIVLLLWDIEQHLL